MSGPERRDLRLAIPPPELNRRISSTTGDEGAIGLIAPVQIAIVGGTAAAGITVARARELWL